MEEWKPVHIAEFSERYEISTNGRVRNVESRKFLHGWHHSHREMPKITLNMKGAHRDFFVKELVWGAFDGTVAASYQIGEKDGDVHNVRIENLYLLPQMVGIHPGGSMRKYIRTVDEFWDQFFAEHAPTCWRIIKQGRTA